MLLYFQCKPMDECLVISNIHVNLWTNAYSSVSPKNTCKPMDECLFVSHTKIHANVRTNPYSSHIRRQSPAVMRYPHRLRYGHRLVAFIASGASHPIYNLVFVLTCSLFSHKNHEHRFSNTHIHIVLCLVHF